jgi:hypothetical protein
MVRASPAQIIITPTLWHIIQSAQTVRVKDISSSDRFFLRRRLPTSPFLAILILEARPRGDFRVAPTALPLLFLRSSGCVGVGHIDDPPSLKGLCVSVALAVELESLSVGEDCIDVRVA